MKNGSPFVARSRRSVPLICGALLLLALTEGVALGSCGDYLMSPGGSHAVSGVLNATAKDGMSAETTAGADRHGMPSRGESRCSSGRCEGIPPLPNPAPLTRTEANKPIHFLIDAIGGEGDPRLSCRWSLPADDRFPQSHKGSVEPPPPKV